MAERTVLTEGITRVVELLTPAYSTGPYAGLAVGPLRQAARDALFALATLERAHAHDVLAEVSRTLHDGEFKAQALRTWWEAMNGEAL